MSRPVRVAVLALVAMLPSFASAWELRFAGTSGNGAGSDVAVDAAGDVVATGTVLDVAPTFEQWTVVKAAGADGRQLWRRDIDGDGNDIRGSQNDSGQRVLVDAAGDVVASGLLRNVDTGVDATVVKLAGATGASLWTHVFAEDGLAQSADIAFSANGDVVVLINVDGRIPAVYRLAAADGGVVWGPQPIADPSSDAYANGLAIDAGGDVLVTAVTASGGGRRQFWAVKLAGATGTEHWRHVVAASASGGSGNAVIATPSGDVVVGGQIIDGDHSLPAVALLAGDDGTERWRTVLPIGRVGDQDNAGITSVGLDANGDVLATGVEGDRMAVWKLAGDDGASVWRRRFQDHRVGEGREIVVDGAGDAVVIGRLGFRFAVLRLRPDGKLRWSRRLPGNTHNVGIGFGAALDASGDVLATGMLVFPLVPRQGNEDNAFAVMKLDGERGAVGRR